MDERIYITIPISAAVLVASRRDSSSHTAGLSIEKGMRVRYTPSVVVSDKDKEGTVVEIGQDAYGFPQCRVKWDDGVIKTEGFGSLEPLQGTFDFDQDRWWENHNAGLVKTAISLPDLVRETNAFSKKYRPGCTPSMLDSNPKALFLHYNVKCNKEDSDPGGHDVRVQFDVTKVMESQQAKDLDIQVSCSCPAFLYWGAQWNLHQRDGLLGTPRPKLVAPTERLDLRGNYVICKHVHSVFERILPSVQHNVVKILREREVRKNKEKVRETPARLKKKQDELKHKKQLEKIKKIKNKRTRERMLDALREEEQARLTHEQDMTDQSTAPGEPPTTEEQFVEEQQNFAPAQKKLEENDDDLVAMQELVEQESDKIEEAHKQGLPHLHKGLPYDIEPNEEEDEDKDDRIIRKFESQHTADSYVDPEESRAKYEDLKRGMKIRYYFDSNTKGTIVRLRKDNEGEWAEILWDNFQDSPTDIRPYDLVIDTPQMGLFASEEEPNIYDFQEGMRVKFKHAPHEGIVKKIVHKEGDGYVQVDWDNGAKSSLNFHELIPLDGQMSLFASSYAEDFKNGMRVKYYFDPTVKGTVKKIIDKNTLRIHWDDLGVTEQRVVDVIPDEAEPQMKMFSALAPFKRGDIVYHIIDPSEDGVVTQVRKLGEDGDDYFIRVQWDREITWHPMINIRMHEQMNMFSHTAAKFEDLHIGTEVKMIDHLNEPDWGKVIKIKKDKHNLQNSQIAVRWPRGSMYCSAWQLATKQKLLPFPEPWEKFSSSDQAVAQYGKLKVGDKVWVVGYPKVYGIVREIIKNRDDPQDSDVLADWFDTVDNKPRGQGNSVALSLLRTAQTTLFSSDHTASKFGELGVGDEVDFDANPDIYGVVTKIFPNKERPQYSTVAVDWYNLKDKFQSSCEIAIHRLRTRQKSLFSEESNVRPD